LRSKHGKTASDKASTLLRPFLEIASRNLQRAPSKSSLVGAAIEERPANALANIELTLLGECVRVSIESRLKLAQARLSKHIFVAYLGFVATISSPARDRHRNVARTRG